MATITALTENFNGAAAGVALSNANSVFDNNLTGAGTKIYNADTYTTGQPSVECVCTANGNNMRADHAAAGGWRGVALKWLAAPDANTAFLAWFLGNSPGTHGGDCRIQTDNRCQLRNASNTQPGSAALSTSPLSTNSWYYFTAKVNTNDAQMKGYNSTGTLVFDSGTWTSGFTLANPDNLRIGQQNNMTGTMRFARMRGDDATEMSTGITGGAGFLTFTDETRTIIDCTGSTGTITCTYVSGDTPTISVVGNVITITHPGTRTTDIVVNVTATSGGIPDTTPYVIPFGGTAKATLVWNGTAWI